MKVFITILILGASLLGCAQETPKKQTIQERDTEVLRAALLVLLEDPDTGFDKDTLRKKIVLHEDVVTGSGMLSQGQMESDSRRSIPEVLGQAIRNRNRFKDETGLAEDNGIGAKQSKSSVSDGYFQGWDFSDLVQVEDLDSLDWSLGSFPKELADVCGHASTYLPGYSEDRREALVRMWFGPNSHGGMATFVLELKDGKWVVVWHKLAFFA